MKQPNNLVTILDCSVNLRVSARVVGWVELRETHHTSRELVGLVKLDPPYIIEELFGPTASHIEQEMAHIAILHHVGFTL
jgi:hypothetical protein